MHKRKPAEGLNVTEMQCHVCVTVKERAAFPQTRLRSNSPCRACMLKRKRVHAATEGAALKHKALAKKRYWENPEKARTYSSEKAKRHRQHNPAYWLLSNARQRAKAKGVALTITLSDIIIPERCPILGTVLRPQLNKSPNWGDAPSIDRLDSSKGYVPGNCIVISRRANVIKSMGSAEEHERVASWMRQARP